MAGEITARQLVIRPSRATFGFVGVLFTIIAGIPIAGAAAAVREGENGRDEILLGLALLVFFSLCAYRSVSTVVVADDRGLLVRNPTRTTRLAWSAIEDFRLGGRWIVVLLRDDEVLPLMATERWYPGDSHQQMLRDLREWLPRSL